MREREREREKLRKRVEKKHLLRMSFNIYLKLIEFYTLKEIINFYSGLFIYHETYCNQ